MGVGQGCRKIIPDFSKIGNKGQNSPPQSVCKAQILEESCFSTKTWNLRNIEGTSDLCFIGYIQ